METFYEIENYKYKKGLFRQTEKCAVFLLIHSHIPKRAVWKVCDYFSELSDTRAFIFIQFLRAKHQIIILHKAVSAGEVLIHCRFLHGKLMESKCFPSVHRALNARRICNTLALTARKITEIHIIFDRNVLSLFYP